MEFAGMMFSLHSVRLAYFIVKGLLVFPTITSVSFTGKVFELYKMSCDVEPFTVCSISIWYAVSGGDVMLPNVCVKLE